MQIEIKINDEKEEWRMVREKVFMEEQGFQNEFDEIDAIALHLCLYVNGKIAGCGRLFEQEKDCYAIGRVALLKEYRKGGYGSKILEALKEEAKRLKARKLVLSAQCQAVPFYEKNGYQCVGEVYLDEHCPHIHMEQEL